MTSGEIELNPSEKIMFNYLDKITSYWDEYVRKFHNFLNEDTLQIFVQPTIMGKEVEWSAGQSPNLYFLMNQDKKMLDDIAFIPHSIKNGFQCVLLFLERMRFFMNNFKDGHETDIEAMKRIRDVNVFRKLADKFVKQLEAIEDVVSYQPLGLIFLCISPFQEQFRPMPKKLLDVIITVTPE